MTSMILGLLAFMAALAVPSLAQHTPHIDKPVAAVEVANFPMTSFDEVMVSQRTPEIRVAFPTGFDSHYATLTFTGNGSTTTLNNTFTLQTAASANSSAQMCSVKALRYPPGTGVHAYQTAVFPTGAAGSTHTIGIVSSDFADGYGYQLQGTTFGLFRSSGSVLTFTPQSAWNYDKLDGKGPSGHVLDTSKLNIYAVSYGWLGSASIRYFVGAARTRVGQRQLVLVHEDMYSGTQVMPHSVDPSLKLCAKTQNTTNTTQMRLRTPSHGAFLDGAKGNGGVHHATSTIQTSVGTTLYPVLTLRSTQTFRGSTNRVSVRMAHLSVANEATNRALEIRVIKNATSLTGASFVPHVDAFHSTVDVDTTATAMSGGELVMNLYVGQASRESLRLYDDEILLEPGDTLTFAAVYDTGSADVKIGVSFKEEF